MKCLLRGNIECNKLKFLKDEKYCSAINKYLKDMHHTECAGEDEFTKSLGTICPNCGDNIKLGQTLCTRCGYNLRNLE